MRAGPVVTLDYFRSSSSAWFAKRAPSLPAWNLALRLGVTLEEAASAISEVRSNAARLVAAGLINLHPGRRHLPTDQEIADDLANAHAFAQVRLELDRAKREAAPLDLLHLVKPHPPVTLRRRWRLARLP